jgi:pimeloyl-ACP methyl ester carboxylesterase
LADHLHLERFAILSYSLGGPYGMACAYAMPEHLTKVGIVSGAAVQRSARNSINEGTHRYQHAAR